MAKSRRHRCSRWVQSVHRLRAAGYRLFGVARRICRAYRPGRRVVPVEILIADQTRRRALERELRTAFGRLQRAFGVPLPTETAVIVQQAVWTDRQLAGCSHVGQRPDGARFAWIRLALQVNGRRLSTDEVLAALAEQYIGLATQLSGNPTVLVPVEFEPARPAEGGHSATLQRDPLVPRSHRAPGQRVA